MPPMSEAEYRRQMDDAYRAVGRYVVEFSQLIGRMRNLLTGRLAGKDVPQALSELALGEATAHQIMVGFFGACRWIGEFDAGETEVEKSLRKRVVETIEKRNDVAHGDWWIGILRANATDMIPPKLVRIRPLRENYEKTENLSASDIDAQTDEIIDLINVIEEFGRLALGLPVHTTSPDGKLGYEHGVFRVSDVLVKDGSVITRSGPRASEVEPMIYFS